MKQQKQSLQRGHKHPVEISVSKTLRNQLKIDYVKFVGRMKAIPCRKSGNEFSRIETIDWGDYPPQVKRKIIRVPSAQHIIAIRKSIAIHNRQYQKNKNEKSK